MKRNLLVSFCFLAFTGHVFAQNPLVKQWDYRYGGTIREDLTALHQTFDGGFIIGGWSWSGIGGDKTEVNRGLRDYWIVKTDSFGNKLWDKTFGGTDEDYLYAVKQTSDRGYILGGFSRSGIGGDKTQANQDTTGYSYDYWIVKTDSLGNKQWDKVFGGTDQDNLYAIEQTNDGGFIVGGGSYSGIGGDKTEVSKGGKDYWIVKLDSMGLKQWDKDFGGTSLDEFYSLRQTTDHGYILAGCSSSGISGDKTQNTHGNNDYWIVKTDSLGNKQWDKDIGGPSGDDEPIIQQTNDGGYILGAGSSSGIGGDKSQVLWDTCMAWSCNKGDFWIVKTDASGNKIWDRNFGGLSLEYYLRNITQTFDNGYLIVGTSYSNIGGDKTENNLGQSQTWAVKLDSLGNKKWDKTLQTNSGSAPDYFCFSNQARDGCYVIANSTAGGIGGDKTQPSQGYYDYWMVKFCDTTLTTSVSQIHTSQFSIYPNPTNSILSLSLNGKENIFVTNLLGEIVLQKTAEGKTELGVSFLSAGIYFIKAGSEVRKFVKE